MLNNFKIDNDVLIVFNRKDNREMIADATDYDIVSKHTWCIASHGYALTSITGADGKQKKLYAHRLLMNPPADMEVDHINSIKHDNRKANLRIVTSQVNSHNRKLAKGYCWNKNAKKWQAQIRLNGKLIHLGLFVLEADAHNAYLEAKKVHHIV